ncbi:hypothetical protein [Aureimonas psammosilenae]|uniref:hypothetical protein n=1 Tax=Aureimonas psammosilenae TaxID=2495496 RepID=UPI0012607967|nr:hypothetical protein [Aureimonas psammosilenae]
MSVFTRFADWARQNFIKTLLTVFVSGGGTVWAAFYGLEQARIARFEERMLTAYGNVSGSAQAVAINLDKLSYQLSTGKKTDDALRRDLSGELVKMYGALETFKLGLDPDSIEKISSYQAALTNLKTEILKTKKIDDLQYLASRFADTERAFASAKPVIERQIGVSLVKG